MVALMIGAPVAFHSLSPALRPPATTKKTPIPVCTFDVPLKLFEEVPLVKWRISAVVTLDPETLLTRNWTELTLPTNDRQNAPWHWNRPKVHVSPGLTPGTYVTAQAGWIDGISTVGISRSMRMNVLYLDSRKR